MPGNSNSPYPHSQVPNVRHQEYGRFFDVNGNQVPLKSPGSHIPLKSYEYKLWTEFKNRGNR